MPLEKVPKEHNGLLLSLKRSLTADHLEDIKLVVRASEFGGFQDAELEKIKSVRDMLLELEVKGVIKAGDYTKLKEIMESIGNVAVIEYIDNTEKLLHQKGYGVASAASNTETTSKRVSQPHQPLDNSSGETAEFMVKDGPLQVADMVEQILKRRYMTTGSFVQIIPWVGDDMKSISDIYTKLKLKNTDHQGKLLKSYEDMFLEKTKEGHSIKRIILEGRAGVGKSTLIDKMAYDWAIGEKLQDYKLVIILKMFALEESSEFIDAIFNHLIDEDVAISKDNLMSYITTNPEKVLILFDGFDEFKTTDVSEASSQSSDDVYYRILNRKILRGSCVVVTTRPSHFHKLVSKPLVENPFVHVLVLGFNGEDIEKYIHSFFSDEDDKSEALLQRIKSSDVLFDLAMSPMLLLLMCVLWREQSTIPDTMYRLYKEALGYIFKRKQLPPDETTQVMITIGEKALNDLLSPQQFLSFKEGDFDDQALRSALKAGVLTSQRVIKGLDTRHSVSFIHRTFQEYCAAIFFQSLLGINEEQFNTNLNLVENIMKNSHQHEEGLEYLLRFCCGDNQSFTNKVLSLKQKCFRQGTMIEKELSVKYYFEGQFEDLPSVDLVTEKMNIEGYSNDGLCALFYYLKHVKDDDRKKGRENAQLSKVTSLSFSRCILESFCEDLGGVMSGMTSLSEFGLNTCAVTPASMKYIAPKLTELTINPNDISEDIGGSVSSWGYNLQSLNLLTSLTLIGCDFQHKDIIYIAASLGMMKNLVNCKLQRNKDFLEQVVECGKQMTSMSLCEYSLSSSDLSEILSGIKNREDCFIIDLSCNPLLGGSADIWAQYLKYLKHLRELFLRECDLQSKDIEPLAASLSDMSTLARLDLSNNPSLGGNAALWAAHLRQLNPLKEMHLCNCSLTGVDIEPIAKSVVIIDYLALSNNCELRHSVASWAPSLTHFDYVKKICLLVCDFTSEDKTLIKRYSNICQTEWISS